MRKSDGDLICVHMYSCACYMWIFSFISTHSGHILSVGSSVNTTCEEFVIVNVLDRNTFFTWLFLSVAYLILRKLQKHISPFCPTYRSV